MKDVEANLYCHYHYPQLIWFHEGISVLSQKPKDRFFFKNEKVENGMVEVSKFRAKFGWVMRCIVCPCTGGRFFIHIPLGQDKQGWVSLSKMLRGFKLKHEYMTWYSSHSR